MSFLNKFLGVSRWQQLRQALIEQSSVAVEPSVSTKGVLVVLLVGVTPVLLTLIDSLAPETANNLATVGFGVCALLSIIVRWKLKLPFRFTRSWRPALSLTHTAVALGCIPAVVVLILAPDLLAERHDVLTQAVEPSGPPGTKPKVFELFGLVLLIAAWVAVVEEVIFRGMMVSAIRRWSIIPTQRQRDITAAVVSALIFGIAHYATWGPYATIALIGLGLGFVAAYLATGEQLMPVVLYHFVFDTLSIGVSVGF